jgi:hypothetical protein
MGLTAAAMSMVVMMMVMMVVVQVAQARVSCEVMPLNPLWLEASGVLPQKSPTVRAAW